MFIITVLWEGMSLALSALSHANDIKDFTERITAKKLKYNKLSYDLYLEFQSAEYDAMGQFKQYMAGTDIYDEDLYSEIIKECSLYSFGKTENEHIDDLMSYSSRKGPFSTVVPSYGELSPIIDHLREKYASNDVVMNWIRIYDGIFCNVLLLPKYRLLNEWYQFSLANLSFEKLKEIDKNINYIATGIDSINNDIKQIDEKLDKSSSEILNKLSAMLNILSLWITLSLFGSATLFVYILFLDKDYTMEHILMVCVCLLITDPLLYKAREPINVYLQRKQRSTNIIIIRMIITPILIIAQVGLCIILQNIFTYYFNIGSISIDILSLLIPCTIIQVVRSIKEVLSGR